MLHEPTSALILWSRYLGTSGWLKTYWKLRLNEIDCILALMPEPRFEKRQQVSAVSQVRCSQEGVQDSRQCQPCRTVTSG